MLIKLKQELGSSKEKRDETNSISCYGLLAFLCCAFQLGRSWTILYHTDLLDYIMSQRHSMAHGMLPKPLGGNELS